MLKPGARVKAHHSNVHKALHRQPTRQLSKRKDSTEAHPAAAPPRKHSRSQGERSLKPREMGHLSHYPRLWTIHLMVIVPISFLNSGLLFLIVEEYWIEEVELKVWDYKAEALNYIARFRQEIVLVCCWLEESTIGFIFFSRDYLVIICHLSMILSFCSQKNLIQLFWFLVVPLYNEKTPPEAMRRGNMVPLTWRAHTNFYASERMCLASGQLLVAWD